MKSIDANNLSMDHSYIYLIFFIMLFLVMALYFKVADRYNIIDKPNSRSSHTLITVRGGGVIFPVAAFIYTFYFGFDHFWFLVGLLLMSVVSLIDDIKELNGNIRMAFQFLAIGLLFYDLGVFQLPFYGYIPLLIFCIATLNAWNFMDGINGITGGYSLLTLLTLIYINDQIVTFSSTGFMITLALALVVFIFYNFRTQARCFAGDIGSISIAFVLIFLMINLIMTTGNFNYILLILLYGLDAASTVFFRLLRKEKIMEPHRSHFYQYLANEKKLPHNTTSLLYMLFQLLVNILVITLAFQSNLTFIATLILATILFIALRFSIEGRQHLLGKTTNQQRSSAS